MNSPAASLASRPVPGRGVEMIVKAIALAGVILFGAIAIVVAFSPRILEQAAHGYVSQRLQAEIESLAGGSLEISELTDDPALVQRYADQLTAGGAALRAAVEQWLQRLVECACKFDCAARAKARILLDAVVAAAPADARAAILNIQAIAQGRFDIVLAKLRHEILLISAINTAIFAALLLIAWIGKSWRALIPPTALLSASTLITAGMYVFGTNWWWTVLTDGYWGMGYLALDAIVALFLFDAFFLDGKITTGLMDSISAILSMLTPNC
jgi:hypothetical protein